MKKLAVSTVVAMTAASAFAHPGSEQEHEHLGVVAHLVVTALPIVVALALIGLLAYSYRRKA